MADYIKTSQVAELLGIDVDEAQALIRRGVLPGIKVANGGGWYVDRATVLAYNASTDEPS